MDSFVPVNPLAQRAALKEERLSIQRDALDDEARTLAAQVEGSETREERFALEKKLLDKAYEIEKSAILVADAKGKIADGNVALANLATRRLVDEQNLAKQSASPPLVPPKSVEGAVREAPDRPYKAVCSASCLPNNRSIAFSLFNLLHSTRQKRERVTCSVYYMSAKAALWRLRHNLRWMTLSLTPE